MLGILEANLHVFKLLNNPKKRYYYSHLKYNKAKSKERSALSRLHSKKEIELGFESSQSDSQTFTLE